MQITEIRFRLPPPEHGDSKFLGVAGVVLDGQLAIHDIRLIWTKDRPLVAMPSRKAYTFCNSCRQKVFLDQKFCGECGVRLPQITMVHDTGGDQGSQARNRGAAMHRDLVHPICPAFRELLVQTVYSAYREQRDRRGSEH